MPERIVDLVKPGLTRWSNSKWAVPAACAAAALILFINEAAFHRSTEALAQTRESVQLGNEIGELLRAFVDAETGQRGYLLTGSVSYLEPYRDGLAEVERGIQVIGKRYAGNPYSRELVMRISETARQKVSEMATTIKLRDEGKDEAWRAVLETGIGREQMRAMRDDLGALLHLEEEHIKASRADLYRTLRISRIGVNAMTALSLLVLLLLLRQAARTNAERQAHADALLIERDRLGEEVTLRTAELTELAQHLQTSREDERARLARDLHDELGALLTAAKLDIARLRRSLAPLAPEAAGRLEHLVSTINKGIAMKRQIIEDLRPSSLNNLGLGPALEILAGEFAQRSEVSVATDIEALRLPDDVAITVYRLVQEALTNVAKYAAASRVEVSLRAADDGVRVSVSDDGRGFDADRTPISSHGLLGMRYRVQAVGGSLRVRSAPGKGTTVEAVVPKPPAHAEAKA